MSARAPSPCRISRTPWRTYRNASLKSLRRLCFHLFGITSAAGGAIAFGSVIKDFLCRENICGFAFPRFKRRILEGSRIGEADFPWMGTHRVHRIEMLRGLLSALAAGQESDTRYRSGNGTLQATDRTFRHFLDARLLRIVLS